MQQVLFTWIVVGELNASSEWVGITQTSSMLPALFLLLAGGAIVDRFDPRRLLISIHLLAALPVALLSYASARGWIDLSVLIAFGLAMGTISALALPARDTLLSRVAGTEMLRAVTGMTAAQFGAQALGALTAGAARWTGSAVMLLVQAVVLSLGSIAAQRLPRAAATGAPRPATRSPLHDVAEGLAVVARTPQLRSPVILVVAVGIFFVGPFLVIFPLMVRDYYHAGVDQLSIVLMLFPLGTIIGSLALRALGVRRKGTAALWALAVGALLLAAIGTRVSYVTMVALTVAWGFAGAVFINCSRTLYQEAAPPEQRGRVLAIYQLGFTGGGPIGALSAGFLSAHIGLHETLLLYAGAMGVLVATMAWASDLPRMH
jgi:MFS family permease